MNMALEEDYDDVFARRLNEIREKYRERGHHQIKYGCTVYSDFTISKRERFGLFDTEDEFWECWDELLEVSGEDNILKMSSSRNIRAISLDLGFVSVEEYRAWRAVEKARQEEE